MISIAPFQHKARTLSFSENQTAAAFFSLKKLGSVVRGIEACFRSVLCLTGG